MGFFKNVTNQPITDVDAPDVLDEESAENEQARARFGWDVHQSDIVTPFLNGDIFEEVYVTQPRGFVKKGQEDKVLHRIVIRDPLLAAPDTSLYCSPPSLCRSSVADRQTKSDAMPRDYIFIVNPNGANGNTGLEWKKLLPNLTAKLSNDCKVTEALTSGPLHAVEIAREAVQNGAHAVVAVGGDGTLHEVVNGFFEDGKPIEANGGGHSTKTALGSGVHTPTKDQE
ncbi:hypothetical protein L7F22_045183 [Adiantum nelumboides]|nr:hypothetical protein [Adiantum nelumboides]